MSAQPSSKVISKGRSGSFDFVDAPDRLTAPLVRNAATGELEPASWDDALDRVAKLMKDDRDANLIKTNDQGVTVNRWNTFGFLASSAASNEPGYLTHKVLRGLGAVAFDTQARI